MESRPVVLGAELAAAHEAEKTRLSSRKTGPSPLLGKAYDVERGDYDLSRVVQLPLDVDIEGLTKRFQSLDLEEKRSLMQSLSLEDNYTLISFAKRMAVRCLNQSSPELCGLGLMSLAMIDEARVDPRDVSWAAGLLNYVIGRWPDRALILFQRASAAATVGMQKLFETARQSTLEDWGYREIKTDSGVGLVESGWAPYAPTLDLANLAALVGDHVIADRYVATVKVATELPSVWFEPNKREKAEKTLQRALGVASLHGVLRRSVSERPNQMFVIWIAEMPASSDCAHLVSYVGPTADRNGRFAVAVTTGRLLALLVAGSFKQGTEPYESASTLSSLAERVRVFLCDALGDDAK